MTSGCLRLISVLVFVILVDAQLLSDDHHWHRYKEQHGKSYRSNRVEANRRRQFESSRAMVEAHNREAECGMHTYNLTLNHLADRPQRRRSHRRLTGLLKSRLRQPNFAPDSLLRSEEPVPDRLDWREKGFKTKGYRQGDCGSCYAFAVASVVEGQVFVTNGTVVEMSKQQLVDCSVLTGNLGCDGGTFRSTARYLEKYGLLERDNYPDYKAKMSVCRATRAKTVNGTKVKSWGVVPYQDEDALAAYVASIGPVAVSVNAAPLTFQLYHSGVYDDPSCSDDAMNHAMLLLGYTPDSWLLKNWWGDTWGQGGYMRLRRGKNRCGIANFAVFLTTT